MSNDSEKEEKEKKEKKEKEEHPPKGRPPGQDRKVG